MTHNTSITRLETVEKEKKRKYQLYHNTVTKSINFDLGTYKRSMKRYENKRSFDNKRKEKLKKVRGITNYKFPVPAIS